MRAALSPVKPEKGPRSHKASRKAKQALLDNKILPAWNGVSENSGTFLGLVIREP